MISGQPDINELLHCLVGHYIFPFFAFLKQQVIFLNFRDRSLLHCRLRSSTSVRVAGYENFVSLRRQRQAYELAQNTCLKVVA